MQASTRILMSVCVNIASNDQAYSQLVSYHVKTGALKMHTIKNVLLWFMSAGGHKVIAVVKDLSVLL